MDNHNIDSHKIHLHPDRIEGWRNDPLHTFPIYVEISPVGRCNHRCTFCAVDYIGYHARQLNMDILKTNLKDMGSHGVKSIMYAGEGEPLLHPDIGEITRGTKEVGIDVAFTTNAVAMTKRFIDEAVDSISWIKVSCNAGDAGTYAAIHQTKEKDWESVWRNISYAVEKKKAGTSIGVQTLLLPDNFKTLDALAQKCKEYGVDYLVVKPYSHNLSSITTVYKDIKYRDLYQSMLTSLKELESKEFKIVAREDSMKSWDADDRGYSKCYSTPYFWAYIMATGDVYGCSAYLQDPRFNYGNINSSLFSTIWLGGKRKEAMRFIEEDLNINECRKNCRMDKVNRYLWELKHPDPHRNFI